MKVHQLTVRIIDFDDLGAEDVKTELECGSFGNDCISPKVARIKTKDIGEWDDDHPLNKRDTAGAEWHRLFNERNGEWIDEHGCCKVCDGEIPYGHSNDCDIYKLEREITRLKKQLDEAMRAASFHPGDYEKLQKLEQIDFDVLKAELERVKQERDKYHAELLVYIPKVQELYRIKK